LGEAIAETRDAGELASGREGKRKALGSVTDPRDRPTLSDQGVDKHLADAARKAAKMREERFRIAVGLVAMSDTIEEAMANAGYRSQTETSRPANEARFMARWKVERAQGARTDLTSSRAGTKFRAYLKEIGLNKNRANECERIGAERLRLPQPATTSTTSSAPNKRLTVSIVIPYLAKRDEGDPEAAGRYPEQSQIGQFLGRPGGRGALFR
jgi:hypothetical protein